MGVVSTICARVERRKWPTSWMLRTSQVGEGLVDEDEAAGAFVVLHQAHEQDQGLDDLLAARGFAVVQADAALAVEVEGDTQLGLAQHDVVAIQVRQSRR